MHETCIECPPQQVDGEDEIVTFTFLSDVLQNPQINESASTTSKNIQQLFLSLEQHLPHWRCYRFLWEQNKFIVNERFAAKKPSYAEYDNRLHLLANVKEQVMEEPLSKTEYSVRLNMEPLVNTVQEIVASWMRSLGIMLNKPAKEDLFNLKDELMVLSHTNISIINVLGFFKIYINLTKQQLWKKLKQSPDTFEDLKSVLDTIVDIKDMSVDVELRFTDIQERYRTLTIYKLEVVC